MSRTFKAIVFDFDGLIVDTELPEYEAWRSVYRSHGVDLPLSTWVPHIGGGNDSFDIYDHLAEVCGRQIDRAEVRRQCKTAFDALFEQAAPLPGVEDYIASAREQGLWIGIASSPPRSWVHPKLEQIGLADFFDTVVCSDDVGSVKPNPASYLTSLANLSVTDGIRDVDRECTSHYDIWFLLKADGRKLKVGTEEFLESRWVATHQVQTLIDDRACLGACRESPPSSVIGARDYAIASPRGQFYLGRRA